jgi:hypothetical protein
MWLLCNLLSYLPCLTQEECAAYTRINPILVQATHIIKSMPGLLNLYTALPFELNVPATCVSDDFETHGRLDSTMVWYIGGRAHQG